jgi:hypothetical protein
LLQRHQHCIVFNLLAGVPKRRPYSDSVTALDAGSSPSGLVPGGGAGGRDIECFVFYGREEGPDCILKLLFWVLLVIVGGSVVIYFSSVVLYVTCKPAV